MTGSLTPIIFRLVNFGIIMAAGVYLYRRFGREFLQEMFTRYEKQQQALRDEVVLLAKRTQEIEEAFVAQHAFGMRLAHNVDQWKESVSHAIALRQIEKGSLTTILQQKAERVARHTAWISLRRVCLVTALQEATESLTAFYADETHAQEYLATAFSRLAQSETSLDKRSLGKRPGVEL